MEYNYQFYNIYNNVNNINEKDITCDNQKLIKFNPENININGLTDLNFNTDSITQNNISSYDPFTRLSVYSKIINENITTFNDIKQNIFTQNQNKCIKTLKSCPVGISYNSQLEFIGRRNLNKEADRPDNPNNLIYKKIQYCARIEAIAEHYKMIANYATFPDDEQTQNINLSVINYNKLFNNQTIDDNNKYNLKWLSSLHKNSIIYASDILIELSSFIGNLEKIKQTQFNISYLSNQITCTSIIGYLGTSTILATGNFNDDYDNVPTQRSQIYVAPFTRIPSKNDICTLQNTTNNILTEDKINLNNITKCRCLYNNSFSTIPTCFDKSNGIFSYNWNINTNNYKLFKDIDFDAMFNIAPGKIISRKNILHTIDYIFYIWLQNIQSINYSITICHTNCHYNSINFISLLDTACCICGCFGQSIESYGFPISTKIE